MKFHKHIRYQVWEKYSGRCAYCGIEIKLTNFQVDHIEPDHNNNDLSNLNPSCRECNFYKSDLTLEQFRKKILTTKYVLQHLKLNSRILQRFNILYFNDIKIQFYFEQAAQVRHSFSMELKK
jgi:HNH endonuclease